MTLVKNWRSLALAAHSMWAAYLGFLQLAVPELLYLASGYQVGNPYFTGWSGLFLIAYGIFGRLVDQGVDVGDRSSSFLGRNKAILLVLVLLLAGNAATAMGATERPEQPGQAVSYQVSEQEFAAIAVPFVGKWEGLRLTAYRDIVGVWTVCYGHTKGVKAGDTYSKAQCDQMFEAELLQYRGGLHGYFTEETVMQRLTPKRDTAYVSLAYNVGIAGAGKSTATRRLNAGYVAGGCEALTWWNKAGGRVVRGLVRRRSEEQALCLADL